ncbi:MAG TPA: aldo/keto reductase, partial [Mesorhizobium sp.]|nr:aldo/keto reductase [Mesorhizobium sp.]
MTVTRRTLMKAAAVSALTFALPDGTTGAVHEPRIIPSSGEAIPAVGLGTWITFNVGDDPVLRNECVAVMAAFFEAGGRMIDSSP